MSKVNTKKLEKLLNLTENTIKQTEQTLKELDCEVGETEATVLPSQQSTDLIQSNDIFTIEQLKTDFALVRQNLTSLTQAGQNILNQIEILDVSDLKASQIDALAHLQQVIGNNLKLLVEIYKQILELEDKSISISRKKETNPLFETSQSNPVTLNQTNVYVGTLKDILKEIKEEEKI